MLTRVVNDDKIFGLYEEYETTDLLLIFVKKATNEIVSF